MHRIHYPMPCKEVSPLYLKDSMHPQTGVDRLVCCVLHTGLMCFISKADAPTECRDQNQVNAETRRLQGHPSIIDSACHVFARIECVFVFLYGDGDLCVWLIFNDSIDQVTRCALWDDTINPSRVQNLYHQPQQEQNLTKKNLLCHQPLYSGHLVSKQGNELIS